MVFGMTSVLVLGSRKLIVRKVAFVFVLRRDNES